MLLLAIVGYANSPHKLSVQAVSTAYDEASWRHDLTAMHNIVDMRFTPEVNSYLRTYLVNGRHKSENILRRMMLYFPIIERKIEEAQLPEELKYIAIVESALDPHARSRSGALGLWQFMAPTAKDYGIRIYHSVDERKDPYRATEAAIAYFSRLYDRFGDWELVLAAYNGGPNRLAKIMAKTGISDYWSLREFLPRETANYVPAFIAATYVFKDFEKHGLIPTRSHPDFHFTTKVEIFNHKVYLKDVAKLMQIDLDTLKYINPMYKRDYIPESPHGYNLILPNRCLTYFHQLRDTLERSDFVKLALLPELDQFQSTYADSMQDIYLHLQYLVQNKENLFTVARMFNLDILQLKYWNNLKSLHVDHGMLVDLPISLVGGKFLIRDYKKIPLSHSIDPSILHEVVVSQKNMSFYRMSEAEKERCARIISKKRDRNTTHVHFTKGIPKSYLDHRKSTKAKVVLSTK